MQLVDAGGFGLGLGDMSESAERLSRKELGTAEIQLQETGWFRTDQRLVACRSLSSQYGSYSSLFSDFLTPVLVASSSLQRRQNHATTFSKAYQASTFSTHACHKNLIPIVNEEFVRSICLLDRKRFLPIFRHF